MTCGCLTTPIDLDFCGVPATPFSYIANSIIVQTSSTGHGAGALNDDRSNMDRELAC
jgi:hypothetical protein